MADDSATGLEDSRWMTQFHELQKQQVSALILQNQNQKTQLEILAMQLAVEKERRHPANDQGGAKEEIEQNIAQQQLLRSPAQIALNSIQNIQTQDFEMGGFGPDSNQGFEMRYSYGTETPQHHNHPYPDHAQQQYQQTQHQQTQHQQGGGNMVLPRITDLDSPDNRLLVALGYEMQPPQTPSVPGPFTPANKRPNKNDDEAYVTLDYPSSGMSESILRPINRSSANKTSASPIEIPKAKRARLGGPAFSEYTSNAMGVPNESSCHYGQQDEALQTYATGVGKLAFALSRKDLEECIMELAFREEEMCAAFYHNATSDIGIKEGLVRSSLLSKCNRGGRKVTHGRDIYPISMGLNKGGELGSFGKIPLELLIHMITFLPLSCVLTFVLGVCKSFRALMSASFLWNQMVIEPKTPAFNSNGFIRFLRSLPETSIRYFSFDTTHCEPTVLNDIVDLILKKKHFGMVSLHLIGKKLSHAMILNALRRLWSENLTIFSLTEVTHSRIDPEVVSKAFLPLMPNLRRLRLDCGVWKNKELKVLSCMHGQLRNVEGNRLIGDNRLTHLSFVGKNTAISWEDLKSFGRWFPELEELFIHCVYADEPAWVEKYANGPVTSEISGALAGIEWASYKYRTPTNEDISWVSMSRLKYFGCDNIGDGQNKKCVKVFEDIHAAYIWSLLKGSRQSLERLELSRGDEHFKYERGRASNKVFAPLPHLIPVPLRNMLPVDFPKLTYLYLGYWKIPWKWFTGSIAFNNVGVGSASSSPASPAASIVDVKNNSSSIVKHEPSSLGLKNVRRFVFWKCAGLPVDDDSKPRQEAKPEKDWVRELKEAWGEGLEAFDESFSPEKALKGNRGAGTW